jgi:hypothetical protein
MQKDFAAYLASYNRKRPYQGRNMKGRTPHTVFRARLPKPRKGAVKTASEAAPLTSLRESTEPRGAKVVFGTSGGSREAASKKKRLPK